MTIYNTDTASISEALGLDKIDIDFSNISEYIEGEYEFNFIPWNKGIEYKSEKRDAAARKNFQDYSKSIKGKTYEEIYGEEKAKLLREKRSGRRKGTAPSGWKIADTSKYSESAYSRWECEEYRKKNSYKWISNLEIKEIKRVHVDEVDEYLSRGWIKGRKSKEIESSIHSPQMD